MYAVYEAIMMNAIKQQSGCLEVKMKTHSILEHN